MDLPGGPSRFRAISTRRKHFRRWDQGPTPKPTLTLTLTLTQILTQILTQNGPETGQKRARNAAASRCRVEKKMFRGSTPCTSASAFTPLLLVGTTSMGQVKYGQWIQAGSTINPKIPSESTMSTPFLRDRPWIFGHVFNVPLSSLLRIVFFFHVFFFFSRYSGFCIFGTFGS